MTDTTKVDVSVSTPVAEKAPVDAVKAGRRESDWHQLHIIERQAQSLWFWALGMFLDDRHKPSMSRIMLALWTIAGWQMILHELRLKTGDVSLQNAPWSAWAGAEGMLALAVFGPGIASYFGPGAAGAVSAGSIGQSVRDTIKKVEDHVSGAG